MCDVAVWSFAKWEGETGDSNVQGQRYIIADHLEVDIKLSYFYKRWLKGNILVDIDEMLAFRKTD